jgi:hypothetical protein
MKTSESISKIAPALLAAQKQITFAAKDATNPHFKSKYADLPSVIDACKPALNSAGIAFMQTAGESADARLVLTTRLLHESGEWIEGTASCPLPKSDPQGFGSAMTYLRRYGMAAIVGLYQEDDDGNGAAPVAKPATKATPEQLAQLANLTVASPEREKRLTTALAFYKVGGVSELSSEQAATILHKLK